MSYTIVHATLIKGATSGTIPSTTAGNTLVVCIGTNGGGSGTQAISGVTLGGSANNFVSLGVNATTPASGTNPSTLDTVWIDPSCAGGQTAIAISGTNVATDSYIYVLEINGIGTPTLDAHASVLSTAGTTSWSSGATG
ncbi:MAG: hypothetical protein ACYCPT_11775, partial [Acidimicrobiales bacterium]